MLRKLLITGMPRSGTSWLGQIVNSNPTVLFRTEPLFSYRFKNVINSNSNCFAVNSFIDNLLNVDDDFMLQKDNVRKGTYPVFEKDAPDTLAFKTTRHFELIEKYIECVNSLRVIVIIRDPRGTINSWIKSDREFHHKGCMVKADWKSGKCRKSGVGEYWGFNDWLDSTMQFLELKKKYNNVHLIKYSDLVVHTESSVSKLFNDVDLTFTEQTRKFISLSKTKHDDDPYSVFKNSDVLYSWKSELIHDIAEEIVETVHDYGLSRYLD